MHAIGKRIFEHAHGAGGSNALWNLNGDDQTGTLDLIASGTIRPELLVGDAGAEAIARARMDAVDR